MQKLTIVMGSLLGACAIHFALLACGSGSKSTSLDTTKDAHAQSASSSCAAWNIATFSQPGFYSGGSGIGAAVPITPGWEPISAELSNSGVYAVVRQCAQ